MSNRLTSTDEEVLLKNTMDITYEAIKDIEDVEKDRDGNILICGFPMTFYLEYYDTWSSSRKRGYYINIYIRGYTRCKEYKIDGAGQFRTSFIKREIEDSWIDTLIAYRKQEDTKEIRIEFGKVSDDILNKIIQGILDDSLGEGVIKLGWYQNNPKDICIAHSRHNSNLNLSVQIPINSILSIMQGLSLGIKSYLNNKE